MIDKIIDVSYHNGVIAWTDVKGQITATIIRAGYRGYGKGGITLDKKFKANLSGVKENEIPFGVYWFGQDITEDEAIKSADYVVNLINEQGISLPIFYDVEYSGAPDNTGRADQLDNETRTNIVVAFCERIIELGYNPGVYASTSWFKEKLDFEKLSKYTIWCAQYNNDDGTPTKEPDIKYDIWQYTSKGSIEGIKGNVDLNLVRDNIIEIETPSNNVASEPVVELKSIDEIAKEVIAGKWGNGEDRKTALEKAGYNYSEVQAVVNKLISKPEEKFKIGDLVTLKDGANYVNGGKIPAWVMKSKMYVRIIRDNGDIVISTFKVGAVTGVVNKKYLTIVK